MRFSIFFAPAALVTLCLFGSARVVHADTSYFVLDFDDTTATPDYSFQFNYTGLTPTAAGMIDVLAADVPTFTDNYTQYSFGRFYTTFGYAGKTNTNASDFSSYWGFWTSTNGINWTVASVGASDDVLSNGSWAAFSFGPNGGAAPITPGGFSAIVSESAAPEPGSIALLGIGGLGLIGIRMRRRRGHR